MAIDRLKWRELVPGLIFSAVVLAVVLGVLLFARVGAVRGDTFVLYAAFSDARQVIPNSEVWLLGEKVGIVEEITFRPPAEDSTAHVLLRLKLWERARPYIRSDATAQLRSGGSLLGAPVVYLSGGTPTATLIVTGDTVRSRAPLDPVQIRANIASGLGDARAVLADLRVVAAGVGRTRSTVSALIGGGGDGRPLAGPVGGLMASIEGIGGADSGSIRLLVADARLRTRATSIQSRLDSLVTAARGPGGTLGRARTDSALTRAVAVLLADAQQLRGEVQALSAALLPRAETDSVADGAVVPIATPAARAALAARAELAELDSALAAVIADAKRRPWRYLPF